MLTSISPLGERARGNRWTITATAYVVGSVLGGATVGGLLGLLGDVLLPRDAPVLLLAAVVCLLAALADLAGLLPHGRRQVDEAWLDRYRGWVYGVGYGYQLGLGVVTIVTSAATYAVVALCALTGSLAGGLAVGATFGLVRALPLLGLRTATSPGALHVLAARLERFGAAATRTTAGLLAMASAVLLLGATT
ncbi:MAG: hypothetical protein JWN35_558 [Frankiales bacterium]|jgi:hypothetical protein|nr:hypothetical protein [Frankiales bacterium]